MSIVWKKSWFYAASIGSFMYTFLPEAAFGNWPILKEKAKLILIIWKTCPLNDKELSSVLGRILFLLAGFLLLCFINSLCLKFKRKVCLKGKNYCIQVEYGDIFQSNCLKVISFDECFTTKIGSAPADIKETSICGQFLSSNSHLIHEIQDMITNTGLKQERKCSLYNNQPRYQSGSVIPYNDYLLLAFAKLDKDGLGHFTSREEYLRSLSVLWKELDKYYGQKDVCIPVLGAGLTRIGDVSPTQQELVDMIIHSYLLSQHKLKSTLHIICRKNKDFSLEKVYTSGIAKKC